MTEEEIKTILNKHKKWLANDPSGEKADFSEKDLHGAVFDNVNLSGVNFTGADLNNAILIGSDFSFAIFRNAILTNANLTNTNFKGVTFENAKLASANLHGSILTNALFTYADLTNANLSGIVFTNDNFNTNFPGADLTNTNFENTDLAHANLTGVILYNTRFNGADLTKTAIDSAFVPQFNICPGGVIIGWKKLRNSLIAKLLIPADAARSSATTRKCRCDNATVLAIYDGEKEVEKGESIFMKNMFYETGRAVKPDSFDTNRWATCTHGIHFFLTRKEAEEYDFMKSY